MHDALDSVSRALGGAVFSIVLALRWFHAQFIKPAGSFVTDNLLRSLEESIKAVVREWFAVVSQNINTTSAFVLALFTRRSYRRTAARRAAAKQAAWHRWWQSAQGTFNALIEQEFGSGAANGSHGHDGEQSEERQQQGRHDGGGGGGSRPRPAPPQPARSSSQKGGRWRLWGRRSSSRVSLGEAPAPLPPDLLRRGSALFELPSGYAVADMVARRGLLEDLRVGAEAGIDRAFGAARRALRRVLGLDGGEDGGPGVPRRRLGPADADSPGELLARSMRRRTLPPGLPPTPEDGGSEEAAAAADAGEARVPRRAARRPPLRSLLRSGRHWGEDLSVWTASDVILREGYPLEQHSVTTADGYVLQVHRMPRHGARDVALFQHGVLDTSLGWVANGVQGSAAFAAWDAGFDVWLGNSRSNAPRLHRDPERQGSRYWRYSMNELGQDDIAAAVEHIHRTKMAELAGPGRHAAAATVEQQQQGRMQRAATDSQLGTLRWVDVRSGSAEEEHTAQQQQQQQRRQQGLEGAEEEEGLPRDDSTGRWWSRLSWRRGRTPAPHEPGGGQERHDAPPLRRTQSAAEPLHSGSGRDLAVPISLSRRQEAPNGAEGGGGAAAAQPDVLPYRLQAVGHSLGAASLLIYAVTSRMAGRPHRLRRLVLMSPAGFHPSVPMGLRFCVWLFPALAWLVDRTPGLRGRGLGLRLPSPLLRYISFKLAMDLRHMPALQDLVKGLMRTALSGDASQWDAALQMPHYSTYSMPALSLHCGAHFAQWSRDLSFRLFDYGSAAANRRHYGADRPPSLAEHYRLLDFPVELLAGAADGVIPPRCVARHVHHLRAAGVPFSFRVLPLGHMDMTLAVKDEIRAFVLSKLTRAL